MPEVFPEMAPGNFTWEEELQGWVWTTFNEWQWDLNWANPKVQEAFEDILRFWLDRGVEVGDAHVAVPALERHEDAAVVGARQQPEHLAALHEHGPCSLHRRSFAPVAQLSFLP